MTADPYEVLGVSRSAPDSVIKAAYRARIRETHPDAGGDPAEAQAVNDAYEVLTDPGRRAAFDRASAPQPAAERRTPTPAAPVAEEVPSPVYERHELPVTWWKQRLAWIPALVAFGLALGAGGVVGGLAVAVGIVVASYWSRRNALIALGSSAVPAAIMLGTAGVPTTTGQAASIITPIVATAVMLVLWAIVRHRTYRAFLAHAGDTFLTTQARYGLTEYVVADITETYNGGLGLVHLDRLDGEGEWPLPTARHDGVVKIGDLVLVHRGRIVVSATTQMLRAAV